MTDTDYLYSYFLKKSTDNKKQEAEKGRPQSVHMPKGNAHKRKDGRRR